MKELLPYLAPFKRRMLLGLTIKITGTVAELSPKGVGKLIINACDAKISIEKLIPEGKKEMSAGDFIRGRRITETDRFE